jgi:hypothetical protein
VTTNRAGDFAMNDMAAADSTEPAPSPRKRQYEENWPEVTNLRYLITSTDKYIVFIDTDIDIDWISLIEDDSGNGSPSKHNQIMNEAALLETTPCTGLPENMRMQFKRLIGEGIVRSFEHDYDSASKMLQSARNYMAARGEETSRLWYLSASFVATVPFICCGVIVWIWRDGFAKSFGSAALWITLAAVMGAMGALLSVIARTGTLKFDCSSGSRLHYLEGGSRICAGALSGIILGLSVISGIFLAPLTHVENAHSIMMVAAFAAGAVERLVTSIISSVGAGKAALVDDR